MSKKKKIVLVLAVLLVVGLGIGAFLYFRKKEEQDAPVIPLKPVDFTREEQIKQLYQDILGRNADESGLAYWTAHPASIGEIRQIFYNSAEYKAMIK